MTASYRYDVEILHLLVSPAHAYFGRARDGAAQVPTTDADQVELVAGKGIVGDRFFGKAAHMDAAVTLLSIEALEAMAEELAAGPFDPLLTRRNVVLRGAHLAPLLGEEFALESRGDVVRIRAGLPAPFDRPPEPRPGRAGQPRAARPRTGRHPHAAAPVPAAVAPGCVIRRTTEDDGRRRAAGGDRVLCLGCGTNAHPDRRQEIGSDSLIRRTHGNRQAPQPVKEPAWTPES